MFKRLVALTALAVCSPAFAHADSINGFFAVNGTDAFTAHPEPFNLHPARQSLGQLEAPSLSI